MPLAGTLRFGNSILNDLPKSDTKIADAIIALKRADMNQRTRENYINALRGFAVRHLDYKTTKKTFGPRGSLAYRQQVETVKLSTFTLEGVQEIITRHVRAAGSQATAERSARISAASFLRNAKAALNKAEAGGLVLPDPKPFAGVKKPEGATAPSYTSTFNAGELIRKAQKELTEDPSAFIALLLAVGAGLRRGEILNLVWRRVDREGERVLVLANGGGHRRPAKANNLSTSALD